MPAAIFGILVSAFNSILGFLLLSVLIKFVAFFALFFIVKEFIAVLVSTGIFPAADKSSAVTSALSGIPSSVWYFLDIFSFSTGVSTVISAYATRFIIRRIPLIG